MQREKEPEQGRDGGEQHDTFRGAKPAHRFALRRGQRRCGVGDGVAVGTDNQPQQRGEEEDARQEFPRREERVEGVTPSREGGIRLRQQKRKDEQHRQREREPTHPRARPRGPNVLRGLSGTAQRVRDGAEQRHGWCRCGEPRGDAAERGIGRQQHLHGEQHDDRGNDQAVQQAAGGDGGGTGDQGGRDAEARHDVPAPLGVSVAMEGGQTCRGGSRPQEPIETGATAAAVAQRRPAGCVVGSTSWRGTSRFAFMVCSIGQDVLNIKYFVT